MLALPVHCHNARLSQRLANRRGVPVSESSRWAAAAGPRSERCPSGHLSHDLVSWEWMAERLRRSRFIQPYEVHIVTRGQLWRLNVLIWALAAVGVAAMASMIWQWRWTRFWPSGCRLATVVVVQNADPLGQRNQFGQALNLHLLHHHAAMGLDGPLVAPSVWPICLLTLPGTTSSKTCRSRGVSVARRARMLSKALCWSRHVCWCASTFSMARSSSSPTGLVRKSCAPDFSVRTMVGVSPWPVRKMIGSVKPSSPQPLLQSRTVQAGHLHVENDAAWLVVARQPVQQLLGGSVGCHVVPGLLQATFHRRPEWLVVVN
jgi:hypothetical protein